MSIPIESNQAMKDEIELAKHMEKTESAVRFFRAVKSRKPAEIQTKDSALLKEILTCVAPPEFHGGLGVVTAADANKEWTPVITKFNAAYLETVDTDGLAPHEAKHLMQALVKLCSRVSTIDSLDNDTQTMLLHVLGRWKQAMLAELSAE